MKQNMNALRRFLGRHPRAHSSHSFCVIINITSQGAFRREVSVLIKYSIDVERKS